MRSTVFSRRPRVLVLALALALSAQAVTAQVRLPSLGESAVEDITVGAERRLGDQVMRQIRADPSYIDDPVLREYLDSLFQPLVAASRQRGDIEPELDRQFAWEAFLLRERTVNAFALPGGFVGVHLGLIALTTSSDELASVLAHELAHVTQRHIARGSIAAQRNSMVSMAALLLGLIVAARSSNADLANATIVGSQAASIQGQLNFSRDVEREADRMGYGTLTAAGFAPQGMAQMFEKLDSANRLNDSGAFPYLRSHPLTVERISEARSRAMFSGGGKGAPPLRHALMQQRARVLMDSDPQTLHRLVDQGTGAVDAPLRDRIATAYAAALSASLLREHASAERLAAATLALATKAEPREPQAERDLQLLQAQIRLNAGQPSAALQVLDAITVDARGRAPLLMRTQAVLDLQRSGKGSPDALRAATESLQTWVTDHPADAGAWSQLAATADAAGFKLRAVRAEAEARYASGDVNGAIDRLRAGQAAARGAAGQDFIEASVIDARLRELRAQLRRAFCEARASGDNSGPPIEGLEVRDCPR
ncbi:M48 family metalloprotease [Rubrivivax gelatinosus]|uniref:M48 family metalloprotease n=1 Tax=Rubrivivax gelatinosus TaxID=28068 RepID=UPI001A9211EE|nr:M48 family metalloprotease [Rubrivivax gelatinosus]